MAYFDSQILPKYFLLLGFLFSISFELSIKSKLLRCHAFQTYLTSIIPKSIGSDVGRTQAISKLQATSTTNNDVEQMIISTIDNVEKIFAISDLHTDNVSNLEWLKELCLMHNTNQSIGPNDVIIVAGDISHELSKLEETFAIMKESLNCHIFFVWGNHEAWIGGQELDSLGVESSLQKIKLVKSLCEKMGVHTECSLVGSSIDNPVFIVPIESWYDATLTLEECEDLCKSFDKWRWVDFMRCVWPDDEKLLLESSKISNNGSTNNLIKKMQMNNTGQIPIGLTEILANENNKSIKEVKKIYYNWIEENGSVKNDRKDNGLNTPPGLITFSHFLPNQKTLPDWKDPTSDTFHRDEWLDHPVPDISAKFAKVAGSVLIDEQIREIIPRDYVSDRTSMSISKASLQSVQHLHVFGHSHRPKDFVFDNIRYIHNPLGKPAEREMNMVSKEVGFQLIWDCRNQSSVHKNVPLDKSSADENIRISSVGKHCGTFGGEVPGNQIIRYWEEQGGGKKVLARKMKHRKQRRRLEMKRFVRDLELTKQVKTSESNDRT